MTKMPQVKSIKVNALLNVVKQSCGVLFPIISFTYSSRVLGAENIGMYSFGQSIVSYLSFIAALGISTYAIREGARIRNDKPATEQFISEIFRINLMTTVLAYCLLAVLLLCWGKLIPFRHIILIQSLSIVITTIGADWINSIYEDYLYLTVRFILVQVISLAALFLFVKSPEHIYRYTLIVTFAAVGGYLLNIVYLRKRLTIRVTGKCHLKRHIVPLLILFVNNFAVFIYMNSDITILGLLTNNTETGIYTVASKTYLILKAMISAVIVVAAPRFSFLIAQKDMSGYQRLMDRVINTLFIMIMPVLTGVFWEAKNIILLIAGEGYAGGETALSILAFSLPFVIGTCFLSNAVIIPNRQEVRYMVAAIITTIINVTGNFMVIPIMGITGAALTTLIAEVLVFALLLFFSRKTYRLHIAKRNLLAGSFGSLLITFVCLAVKNFHWGGNLELVVSIGLSGICYAAVLAAFQTDISKEAIGTIKRIFRKRKRV